MIEEAKKRFTAFVAIHIKQLQKSSLDRGLDKKAKVNGREYEMRIEAIEAEFEKELLLAKEEGRQEVLKAIPKQDAIDCSCGCEYNDDCLCKSRRYGFNVCLDQIHNNLK